MVIKYLPGKKKSGVGAISVYMEDLGTLGINNMFIKSTIRVQKFSTKIDNFFKQIQVGVWVEGVSTYFFTDRSDSKRGHLQ
jgi:hypothetical protein